MKDFPFSSHPTLTAFVRRAAVMDGVESFNFSKQDMSELKEAFDIIDFNAVGTIGASDIGKLACSHTPHTQPPPMQPPLPMCPQTCSLVHVPRHVAPADTSSKANTLCCTS